jgi:hypothetical protein
MAVELTERTKRVEPTTAPIAMTPPDAIDPAHIVLLLVKDSIQSIDEPQYESVELADKHIAPDERVIGVLINGEARAYPIPIMSSHDIVYDVVGGEPVAITWCPLCYTALVSVEGLMGGIDR